MTASTNQQALPKEHHNIIGYTVATNGKCVENYEAGAWGAVIIANSEHGSWVLAELAGTEDETTCNRIKMTSVIEALKAVRKHPNFEHDCTIEVQSDSKNLVQGASDWIHNWKLNGWRNADKNPVKNREEWEELDTVMEGLTIRYTWIPAAKGETHQQTALRLSEEALDYLTNQPVRSLADSVSHLIGDLQNRLSNNPVVMTSQLLEASRVLMKALDDSLPQSQ